LVQIEENKAIDIKIKAGKELLNKLNLELEELNNDLNTKKNSIEINKNKITELNNLIIEFEKQEKRDSIFDIYKKLLNRNGVPRQLLVNNIIPKINNELALLLTDVDFKVYLDPNDIKLKLVYHNNLDAIIDAISASGKERTFAAISLKYALNQINAKSKPSICIYDEITGKLNGVSIQEFCDIIQSIKKKMKKIIIIEHNIEVNPDYIIDVTKDENGISSLTIE
jgi:DNA repair exonuclease SbcCD ATPase subunit